VTEVLDDAFVTERVKNKLRYIQRVKDFASSQGLTVADNYSTYIDLGEEQRISYLVSAAPRFEVKLKTWNYAFAGKFPYLGFFSKQDRDEYSDFLSAKMKMDVHKSEAAAFSFLGWIDDPIYSTMLNDEDESIAATLFHELTHSTIWINNDVQFNEKIAEFVSEFLVDRFERSKIDQRRQKKISQSEDKGKFVAWILNLKSGLTEYYTSSAKQTEAKRLGGKESIFATHSKNFPQMSSNAYGQLNSRPWNNARLLAVSFYVPVFSDLQRSFACVDSVKVGDWLKQIKSIHSSHDLAFSLEHACANIETLGLQNNKLPIY